MSGAAGRRGVTVLGSTGSVGCNTIELIAANPDRFAVEALVGGTKADLLAQQARSVGARMAVVADAKAYPALRDALAGSGIEAAAGAEAVLEAARRPAEWVMSAIVGAAGLGPTLAAARRGAIIGLANKECLVVAGRLLVAEIQRAGGTLVPVDSEHSAIFQVFDFARPEAVERIILTASGGPFRDWDRMAMASATPAQAVRHPNWSMGAKISVDSATMMNKGLELIEASLLFPVPADRIDILVHPQSVVHSLVAYVDGSVLAQLGTPDMRTPIAFALGWPNRLATSAARLDLAQISQLTFQAPDFDKFPALLLAQRALQDGGGLPTILNAANEIAVAGFLDGNIGFLDIVACVEDTMARVSGPAESLEDILALDQAAREQARDWVARRAGLRNDRERQART